MRRRWQPHLCAPRVIEGACAVHARRRTRGAHTAQCTHATQPRQEASGFRDRAVSAAVTAPIAGAAPDRPARTGHHDAVHDGARGATRAGSGGWRRAAASGGGRVARAAAAGRNAKRGVLARGRCVGGTAGAGASRPRVCAARAGGLRHYRSRTGHGGRRRPPDPPAPCKRCGLHLFATCLSGPAASRASSRTTLEAKSNINPNASVGAPNPGTNETHTKILDFDSKRA